MSDNRFSSAVRSSYDPRNRNSPTSTAAGPPKRPYWAGTEDDSAKQEPAESPARDSGYAYNFVANPYAENPSTHPGPHPHYINAEEVKHLDFPGVREGCWARWAAHERAQPREPLLSPGDIANDHQTQVNTPGAEPSSSSVIRKVSKHVRFDLDNVVDIAKVVKRSLSKKGKKGKGSRLEPTISAPMPGSLRPGGPTPLFPEDGTRPLEVVPLAEAQENRLKYGRPDHELAGISAAAVARRASAVAAAEKKHLYSPSPVPNSPPPPPAPPQDAPKEPTIQWKPVPAPSAPRPQPPQQTQAPPAPTPAVPQRNPLRVINTASTETVWADFVDAGNDASWTHEPQYQNGGEGPVEQGGRTPSRIAREARVLDFMEGGRLPKSPP